MESTLLRTHTLKRKRRRRPWANRKNDSKHEGEDRLSSLPDELLSHILSFLPTTNDAIQASLLSSRWKYLWTCASYPNFEYYPYCPWRASRAKYRSFLNTVDRLFNLRDGRLCIQKFRVFSGYNYEFNPNLDAWISFLMSRNIQDFTLKLSNSLVCQLPTRLFNCHTLMNLILYGKFERNLSTTTVSLPNLKTLWLKSVQYSNSDTVSRLLSGCPVLELLSIKLLSSNEDAKVLNFSAPSLKKLYIYYRPCKPSIDDDEMYDYGTIIDAPNLEFLGLFDDGSTYISLNNNMSSLVGADIDVKLLEEHHLASEDFGTNVMGVLLAAISNVKWLSLQTNATCSLSDSYLHLPKFCNLEHLVIGFDGFGGWELLPNLLESMPILRELVFQKGLADSVTTKFNWSPPEDAPLCLSFHLKTIEINNFYGGEDELKLVKYMLEKARVLEKMTICPCSKSHNFAKDIWLMSRDELLKSPLGSSACEIKFIT